MGRPILIIVGVLIIIFGIAQVSITSRHITMVERSADYASNSQARNIATSMVGAGIGEINKNIAWRLGLTHDDFLGGGGTLTVLDNLADSTIDPNSLVLVANGNYANQNANIRVTLSKFSFARYAYFTHNEINAWFISDDVIRGPMHSNDQIRMFGRPTFMGDVTSTMDYIKYHAATDPDFQGDTDFNYENVTIPTDLTELISMTDVSNGGLGQYTRPVRLLFNDNGTVSISERIGSNWVLDKVVNTGEFNGVISSTEDVHVRGVLSGRVTIHSEKDVRIIGDITYKNNPESNPLSTDMMGIVANNNVVVTENAHTQNGTSNLNIHASLMAVTGSFSVQNHTSGAPRGSLHVLGGIVQNTRGAVGRGQFNTSTGTVNILNGYTKDYFYDNRFATTWPPGFPYRDRYIVINWQE
jgi:cytoskeletal protein CcmA (bactofilin family)